MNNPSKVPNTVPVGDGALMITDEVFLKGYQTGRLAFLSNGRAIRYLDKDIIDLTVKAVKDVRYPEAHCVGFIAGWLIAFATGTPRPAKDAEA